MVSALAHLCFKCLTSDPYTRSHSLSHSLTPPWRLPAHSLPLTFQVLFAYEEAIGFMPGPMYRDKDGVSSAAAFCEMAGQVYRRGSSLAAELAGLYKQYGFSAYRAGVRKRGREVAGGTVLEGSQ